MAMVVIHDPIVPYGLAVVDDDQVQSKRLHKLIVEHNEVLVSCGDSCEPFQL